MINLQVWADQGAGPFFEQQGVAGDIMMVPIDGQARPLLVIMQADGGPMREIHVSPGEQPQLAVTLTEHG